MANTVIQLRSSGVTGNVPSTLQPGELAINFVDGKLFYGNAVSSVVEFSTTTPAGLNGELQFNSFGDLGATSNVRYDSSGGILYVNSVVANTLVNSVLTDAYNKAQGAYDLANTISGGTSTDSWARTAANSASSYANSAFSTANSKFNSSGGTITGDVLVNGRITANATGGDEGGEILLGKALTNTTLSGAGVTIDVYQNKLRIFEEGGSARGVYIDISTASSGVGTNLLASSGSVDSDARNTALSAYHHANGAFAKANTVSIDAYSAGDYANSAFIKANSAFGKANTVELIAQGAFNTANSSASSGSYANSAFSKANTATILAQAAFDKANTFVDTNIDQWVRDVANTNSTNVTSASSYANGAFLQANTATSNASVADQKAVSAGIYANASFAKANTASIDALSSGSYANSAYAQANTALVNAASAGSYANSAYAQANTATTNAATADQRAVTSGSYANSAFDTANTALSSIPSLAGYATESYVANSISNLVDSAPATLDTLNELAAALGDDANFATTISNMVGVAGGYANSAFGVANTASLNATSAGSYANGAFAKANTGNILAQAAFDAANTGGGSSNTLTSGTQTVSLNNNGVITLPASSALYNNTSTLSTNTANQVIDTFSTTLYRTAKYLIQVIDGVDVHSTELLVTHNDTSTFSTEYATLQSGSSLFDIYTEIISSNVEVKISPVNENSTIDFVRTSIISRVLSALSGLEGDLMSLTGTEDLETGSGTVDLMDGDEPDIEGDFMSLSGTEDLQTGSGTIDLN
jgi:hypothetical protein